MHKYAHAALFAYRRRHGLKQEAMAELLGVSQATLSRWESGLSEPTIAMQKRIRDLLYNDRDIQMRKRLKMVSRSLNRSLTEGEEVKLDAHGVFLPFAPLLNLSLLPFMEDFEIEAVRDYRLAAKRGEVIGSISYAPRRQPELIGGGPDLLMAHVSEIFVCDGETYADTSHIPLTQEQWLQLGARPRFELITLDDE